MDNLKGLIKAIKDDSNVKRFKELERIIDENQELNSEYQKLINLQKIMVQDEAKKSSRFDASKEAYDQQLELVMSHVLMSEYLDLLEVVNNDLQLIKQIILEEMNVEK